MDEVMVFCELFEKYINAFERNQYYAAVRRAEEHAETLREQEEEVYLYMLLDSELEKIRWERPIYNETDQDLYGLTRLWLTIAEGMSREIHASGVKKLVTVYKG